MDSDWATGILLSHKQKRAPQYIDAMGTECERGSQLHCLPSPTPPLPTKGLVNIRAASFGLRKT
jgi:hypothetical protein